ncbi:MAG: DNA adenine methylase [Holosporales bacterium]|jgi:DNA adenine methylase|nr:DNA adenine methylase [Holosporales bacterium]
MTSLNKTLEGAVNKEPLECLDIAKPFVKWAGGKRSIVNILFSKIPEEFSSYFEPFVGGGALFWNIARLAFPNEGSAPQKRKAYLSDINSRLIITYRMARDDVEAVISKLEHHKECHSEEYYKKARIRLSETKDPIETASLFIYLNKTCYNGLYRVNKSGVFNVPMGRYVEPKIVDADNLRICSKSLTNADLSQGEFAQIKPQKGDFVYLDPPYHQTFSGYDGSGFGDKEHIELAEFCAELDKQGVFFMLSNSDTPLIRRLYKDYNIENVDASRFISCKANRRQKENELIIRNYVRRDEG